MLASTEYLIVVIINGVIHNMKLRIMKTDGFEDAVIYEAACACGDKSHNLTLWFEKDKAYSNMIFLTVYQDLKWSSDWQIGVIFRIWRRIKAALRILFIGYVEVDSEFIFEGKEQIDDFIAALQEGKKEIGGSKYGESGV